MGEWVKEWMIKIEVERLKPKYSTTEIYFYGYFWLYYLNPWTYSSPPTSNAIQNQIEYPKWSYSSYRNPPTLLPNLQPTPTNLKWTPRNLQWTPTKTQRTPKSRRLLRRLEHRLAFRTSCELSFPGLAAGPPPVVRLGWIWNNKRCVQIDSHEWAY